jgi:rhomboid protease GluP
MPRRTGAILCPSCRKLISIDEPRCPFCGAVRPGLWGYGPTLQRVFGAQADGVTWIVAACVVLYVVGILMDVQGALQSRGFLSFLSPSGVALYRLGMTGGGDTFGRRWWTLLTAIYLHGGLLHIFFNIMWIRQMGANAQRLFGTARFFILFSLAGAGGFLVSNLHGARFSIGASGAIFGLFGALLAYSRRHRSTLGDLASRQVLQWALILLIFGFMTPGVDNLAHLGGFASGFLLGQRLPSVDEKRPSRLEQLAALGLLAITVVGFVLSLTQSIGVMGG